MGVLGRSAERLSGTRSPALLCEAVETDSTRRSHTLKRHLARVLAVLVCCLPLVAAAQNASSSVPPQVGGPAAAAGKTQITWYGHAAFKMVTPSGKVILIDPWITNPLNPNGKQDLADLKKVDLILISHGHSDHVGDAVEIAKRTKAKLVTTMDQAQAYVRYAGFPADQVGYDSAVHFTPGTNRGAMVRPGSAVRAGHEKFRGRD